MVTFICSACGQSLKKSQVDKHCNGQCRHCEMLSCVDCGKEFWGNDYSNHLKCVSEEEKYSGKLYKPRENKGEVKQELWTQQVQRAVDKMNSRGAVKALLLQVRDCANIPRKQAKFQNFLRNSLRIRSDKLVLEAWQAIQTEINTDNNNNKNNNNGDNNNENNNKNNDNENNNKNNKNNNKSDNDLESANLNNDKDSEKIINNGVTGEGGNEEGRDGRKERKKRKKEGADIKDIKIQKTEGAVEAFSWSTTIHNILLHSPNHQLTSRKLRKKFLKEFKANSEDVSRYTEEQMSSKLHKKFSRNSKWTLENDIVKLTVLD